MLCYICEAEKVEAKGDYCPECLAAKPFADTKPLKRKNIPKLSWYLPPGSTRSWWVGVEDRAEFDARTAAETPRMSRQHLPPLRRNVL